MSNYNDLKNHIAGIGTTAKITNAMYLLSTSRMKKDLMTVPALTEYLNEIRAAMGAILQCSESHGIHHKFTEIDTVGKPLYLVILGDKGLCGDHNAEIAELTAQIKNERPESVIAVFNSFGEDYLRRHGIKADFVQDHSTMHFTESDVRKLSEHLIKMYMTDDFNEVYVVSTLYTKTERRPGCFRLLPLKRSDFAGCVPDGCGEVIFEPDAMKLFTCITPEYIMGVLFDLMLQASIAENASRMEAMQSATENAQEMMDKLSAQLNSERQIGITQEITEITASQF